MAGEKGQSRDTIQFSEGSKHDHERCPYILFLLDQRIGENDDRRDADIELRHEKRGKQLVGAEPIDKNVLSLDSR